MKISNTRSTNPASSSLWQHHSFPLPFDFVVVGAGLVGLNAALSLRELAPQSSIALVEAAPFPNGASARNGGFSCVGGIGELLATKESCRSEKVFLQLMSARFFGKNRLAQLCSSKTISHLPSGGIELFLNGNETRYQEACSSITECNSLLAPFTGNDETFCQKSPSSLFPKSSALLGAIDNSCEGVLDSGALLAHLLKQAEADDITVLRGALVTDCEENDKSVSLLLAGGQSLKASHCVLATSAAAGEHLTTKVVPGRSQVYLTTPLPGLSIPEAGFHLDDGYTYFRRLGSQLLIGGGRHLDLAGERTHSLATTPKFKEYLESVVQTLLPENIDWQFEQEWAGTLCLSPEGELPLALLEPLGNRIIFAGRLNGMGVLHSFSLGLQAAMYLVGKENWRGSYGSLALSDGCMITSRA